MSDYRKINLYQRTNLTTVSYTAQVALILEKAARSLELAVNAAEQDNIEDRYKHSMYTVRIITKLAAALQITDENSKKIVQVLREYYSFILAKISEFNCKDDSALGRRLIDSLREMAECWRSIHIQ